MIGRIAKRATNARRIGGAGSDDDDSVVASVGDVEGVVLHNLDTSAGIQR